MQTILPSKLLKTMLLIDAAGSGAMAAAHLLLPGALHAALALPPALLAGNGAFLVAYVALLVALACSRAVWRALVLLVVAGNVGWAAASLALLAGGMLPPQRAGRRVRDRAGDRGAGLRGAGVPRPGRLHTGRAAGCGARVSAAS